MPTGLIAALLAGPVVAGSGADVLADTLVEGRRLYEFHCASCHGRRLEGAMDWDMQRDDLTFPAPPHDQTGHTWHHSDRFLIDYIKSGGGKFQSASVRYTMPAFAHILTDSEISEVITYIKSYWPKEIRDAQEKRNVMTE